MLQRQLRPSEPIGQRQSGRASPRQVSLAARCLGSAVLAVLSVVATFALCEMLLRLAWTPPSLRSTQAFEPHPVYGVAPIPGIAGVRHTVEYAHPFAHTPQGFRAGSALGVVAAHKRAPRVLFLGDSFTYGMGVADDETFVNRVAAALPGVEVVNAGVNGYGQFEELALLDALGPALRPDLTVVVFFWNDLEDNLEAGAPSFTVDSDGRVVRTDLVVPAAFDPLASRTGHVERPSARGPLYYTRELVKEGLKGVRYRYLGISARDIQTEEQLRQAWTVAANAFELLLRRAREVGSRLLVISIPDHNKVDPLAVIKNIEPLNYDVEDALRETLLRLGVPYFDTFDALRSAHESGEGGLYYYADRHLTPRGHRVLADALLPVVAAELTAAVERRSGVPSPPAAGAGGGP